MANPVYIRDGVIYVNINGQEVSAEALEASDCDSILGLTVQMLRTYLNTIDALRDQMDEEENNG